MTLFPAGCSSGTLPSDLSENYILNQSQACFDCLNFTTPYYSYLQNENQPVILHEQDETKGLQYFYYFLICWKYKDQK
jgi:hypothetical protein